jgi:hypothetical protein
MIAAAAPPGSSAALSVGRPALQHHPAEPVVTPQKPSSHYRVYVCPWRLGLRTPACRSRASRRAWISANLPASSSSATVL